MKKLCLLFVIFALLGGAAVCDTGEQEEIDFLLFVSDSSNRFVNHEQAMIQLDNMARFLLERNPGPGQISVYGYAAAAVNDIDAMGLSRERALFVITELLRRGLSRELFADPVAYGAVDFWGSNADEEGWSQNRRVRILLDGTVLTPVLVQAAEPPPLAVVPGPVNDEAANEPRSAFSWVVFLILIGIAIIAAIIFFAARKKSAAEKPEEAAEPAPPKKEAVPVVVPVPAAPKEKTYILTDEEIRCHAYVLCERRSYQNGDHTGDWYQSLMELTALYESQGYRVIRSYS